MSRKGELAVEFYRACPNGHIIAAYWTEEVPCPICGASPMKKLSEEQIKEAERFM